MKLPQLLLLTAALVFTCSFSNSAPVSDNGEDLFKAVTSKNLKLVKKLVEKKGADVNYVRRINDAFYIPVLLQAVMDDSTEIAAYLMNAGAEVNVTDGFKMTCLMWAVNNKNTELVNLLLEKGADKEIIGPNGMTALKVAEDNGYEEIAIILKNK